MKQGDLVLDVDTDDLCIVKEIGALWRDPHSGTHTRWDYLIYHPDYGDFYVDAREISLIQTLKKTAITVQPRFTVFFQMISDFTTCAATSGNGRQIDFEFDQ